MSESEKRVFFEMKPEPDRWLVVEWADVCKSSKEAFAMISSNSLLECNPHSVHKLHTGKVIFAHVNQKRLKATIVHISADRRFIETQLQQILSTMGTNTETSTQTNTETNREMNLETERVGEMSENDQSDAEMREDYSAEESEWIPISSDESDSERISIISLNMLSRNSQRKSSKFTRKRSSIRRKTIGGIRKNNISRAGKCGNPTARRLIFDDTDRPPVTANREDPIGSLLTTSYDQHTQTIVSQVNEQMLEQLVYQQINYIEDFNNMSKYCKDMNVYAEIHLKRTRPRNNIIAPQHNRPSTSRCNNPSGQSTEMPIRQIPAPPTVATVRNRDSRPTEENDSSMIAIGSGKTMVPRHVYNQIKWSSYSSATRKLLMAVFPRNILATHTLTGKPSPAFANKPVKMPLDSRKTADIIMTVAEECRVPENLIRNIITTKCSDENKMYKQRMKKQEKLKNINQSKGNNEDNQPKE